MSGYTKGPWSYKQGSGTVSAIDGSIRRVVARYVDVNNAPLIAAAPELLEALKAINEWLLDIGEPIDRPELWNPLFLKAHDLAAAAIAKAVKP